MMFLILLRQAGVGCGYTIECGQKWLLFSASNLEAAIQYGKDTVRDYVWGDCISESYVIPAESMVDLAPLLIAEDLKAQTQAKLQAKEQQEANELDLYKKLKNKFEK